MVVQNLPQKVISYTIYISLALLLPAIPGYYYIIDSAYCILIYILLTFSYGWIVKVSTYKFLPTALFSAVLFVICGFLGFIGGMAGSVKVENEWKEKGYKVQYIRDQGFAGGPLMKYQLSKYALIPLFIKPVDTQVDDDTTSACWVRFTQANFNFDKCAPDSSIFYQ